MPRTRTTARVSATAAAATLVAGALASTPTLADETSPTAPPPDRPADVSTTTHTAPDTDPAPVAREVDAPVPRLRWKKCQQFRCATPRVPLDYDRPRGPKVRLAVLKVPARKPARKIGTLFVNPGGPGGSATGFAQQAKTVFSPAVLNRFDIVGVDPRGVGGSAPVVCRSDRHAPKAPIYPANRRQERRMLRYDAWLRQACRTSNPRILDHMSTADTARDMDLIRQAVGDEKLTYYGISYGSLLGSTYANMFKGRVRALLVDGVLDPVAWYTGRNKAQRKTPNTVRIGSGKGAWEAWTTALDECDRVNRRRCALTQGPHAKWRTLVRKARAGTLEIEGQPINEQALVGAVFQSMYSAAAYQPLMADLQRIWRATTQSGSPAAQARAGDAWSRILQRVEDVRTPDGPYDVDAPSPVSADARRVKRAADPFHGVLCADAVNPQRPRAWLRWTEHADRSAPWFGRYWTWASSPCARWPGSKADAYRGVFTKRTSTPLVVTGNLHDPATSITGARRLNQLMPGSRLITVDGWGHGAIGMSRCVDRAWTRYLVHRKLPRNGLVCHPDRSLYPTR